MIVKKGGISRLIDEKNLQEYRDKGYTPVEVENTPKTKEKPAKEYRDKGYTPVEAENTPKTKKKPAKE